MLCTYFKFKHIISLVHEYEKYLIQISLSLLLSQNKSRVHLWVNPHTYILQLYICMVLCVVYLLVAALAKQKFLSQKN